MRNSLLALSFLFFPPDFSGDSFSEKSFIGARFANTANDRCAVRDCTCKVTGSANSYYPLVEWSNRISLYYRPESHILDQPQEEFLRLFLAKYGRMRYRTSIMGYTDGCGGAEYNLALSRRRAMGVKSLIKDHASNSSVKFFGEKTSGHSDAARRVDLVIHSRGRIAEAIERIPADVYLIDASGSMSTETWKKIILASKKPGSRIYVSMMTGCENGQNINTIKPQGGTEIWWSYWKVLEKMKPGERLLIISDFKSNYPLTRRESALIEQKVRASGVIVNIARPR
jgi:hypothetical protein